MIVPYCVFESSDYRVYYKAQGIHFDELLPRSSSEDWEAVHRIDFETSGLLLFSRKELVEESRKLFSTRDGVEKIYLAGARAPLPFSEQKVTGFIGSRYRSSKKVRFFPDKRSCPKDWHSVREAQAEIRRLEEGHDPSGGLFKGILYEVRLITGARHQIRATFEALGGALVGDPVYGENKVPAERMELHAWKIAFNHPRKPEIRIQVESPVLDVKKL